MTDYLGSILEIEDGGLFFSGDLCYIDSKCFESIFKSWFCWYKSYLVCFESLIEVRLGKKHGSQAQKPCSVARNGVWHLLVRYLYGVPIFSVNNTSVILLIFSILDGWLILDLILVWLMIDSGSNPSVVVGEYFSPQKSLYQLWLRDYSQDPMYPTTLSSHFTMVLMFHTKIQSIYKNFTLLMIRKSYWTMSTKLKSTAMTHILSTFRWKLAETRNYIAPVMDIKLTIVSSPTVGKS